MGCKARLRNALIFESANKNIWTCFYNILFNIFCSLLFPLSYLEPFVLVSHTEHLTVTYFVTCYYFRALLKRADHAWTG
ncbi:hypothetical protein BDZ91DRAFT_720280, partial [Kalaharituber pfeilii]